MVFSLSGMILINGSKWTKLFLNRVSRIGSESPSGVLKWGSIRGRMRLNWTNECERGHAGLKTVILWFKSILNKQYNSMQLFHMWASTARMWMHHPDLFSLLRFTMIIGKILPYDRYENLVWLSLIHTNVKSFHTGACFILYRAFIKLHGFVTIPDPNFPAQILLILVYMVSFPWYFTKTFRFPRKLKFSFLI